MLSAEVSTRNGKAHACVVSQKSQVIDLLRFREGRIYSKLAATSL